MSDKDTFYKKLKIQLEDTTVFPADYLYKFIVPTDKNQAEDVLIVFKNTGAVIKTKKSKTGKYISVSVVINAVSSDEIISYYRQVEEIKGILSL